MLSGVLRSSCVLPPVGRCIALLSPLTPAAQVDDWTYDFTLMSFAAAFIFGTVGTMPAMLWGGMRYLGVPPPRLSALVALFGYSAAVYIPASVRARCPVQPRFAERMTHCGRAQASRRPPPPVCMYSPSPMYGHQGNVVVCVPADTWVCVF